MAEASIATFGAAARIAIALSIVCFILCRKGHSDGSHNYDYDKVTTDDVHVHHD